MISNCLFGFLDLDVGALALPSALYLASRSFLLRLRSRSSWLRSLLATDESELRLAGRLGLAFSGGSAKMSSSCGWP